MDEIYEQIRAMADSGGSYSATTATAPAPSDSGLASGLLQQAMAMGGSYLNRRLDIDLAQRLGGGMPQVYRNSNQTPIYGNQVQADLTTRGVQAVGGMRMGDMLPFLIGGVILFMVLK